MLLVTGGRGQLGAALSRILPDAIYTDSKILDITDARAVTDFVRERGVNTIVNCAAYTAVDAAEDDRETAMRVNVDGPRNLAQTGATIVHISTDYVFDGCAHRPYVETDTAAPASFYGQTKLDGERTVLDVADTALIIRTSWLHSADGTNFVKTMLRLGRERDSIGVVCDQIGTPTFAGDLAAAIAHVVPCIRAGQKDIYHYSNEGVCSWYDFAHEIMKQAGLACRVNPIESKDYPTKAVRPFYSVMNKAKVKGDFGIAIPHWNEGLKQCLNQFS